MLGLGLVAINLVITPQGRLLWGVVTQKQTAPRQSPRTTAPVASGAVAAGIQAGESVGQWLAPWLPQGLPWPNLPQPPPLPAPWRRGG